MRALAAQQWSANLGKGRGWRERGPSNRLMSEHLTGHAPVWRQGSGGYTCASLESVPMETGERGGIRRFQVLLRSKVKALQGP